MMDETIERLRALLFTLPGQRELEDLLSTSPETPEQKLVALLEQVLLDQDATHL